MFNVYTCLSVNNKGISESVHLGTSDVRKRPTNNRIWICVARFPVTMYQPGPGNNTNTQKQGTVILKCSTDGMPALFNVKHSLKEIQGGFFCAQLHGYKDHSSVTQTCCK